MKTVLKEKIAHIKNINPKIPDELITLEELKVHHGQVQNIVNELSKSHENALLQTDKTETENATEEHNKTALKDTVTTAINFSRNILTRVYTLRTVFQRITIKLNVIFLKKQLIFPNSNKHFL